MLAVEPPPDKALPIPSSERIVKYRSRVSPARWERVVKEALERLRVVKGVIGRPDGTSQRSSLMELAPGVHWSTYLQWRRKHLGREGPEWERLIDTRVPPTPPPIPDTVRVFAIALRTVQPTLSMDAARQHLTRQFGESGRLSNSSLGKIWKEAGLNCKSGDASRFERVQKFNGGGGLAMIGAAVYESGVPLAMAKAAIEAAASVAEAQSSDGLPEQAPVRGPGGRFSADFNQAVREGIEPGDADSRWDSDTQKRNRRRLQELSVLALRPETMAQRLVSIGLVPLVTERRGFDGMEGLRANWTATMGYQAYQPATLDKTLAELALLNVGDALWAKHGELWSETATTWSEGGPAWRQMVRYVDVTTDPYWTKRYAASGKVSRVGKVMPCLSRVAVMGGPGVPLLMKTVAGAVSLKKLLIEAMNDTGGLGGPGDLARITVVDAEAGGSVPLLTELTKLSGHRFITVLKGMIAKNLVIEETGDWQPYRENDHVREGIVVLRGKSAPKGGLKLRVVEMERVQSRNPQRTLFATNPGVSELSTADIADIYLSRWPNQEGVFREARNGAGLDRSHGYGGEYVTHVAFETKFEQAKGRLARASNNVNQAKESLGRIEEMTASVTEEQSVAAQEALKQAQAKLRESEKALVQAENDHTRQQTMPKEIFQRDTTRENIATSLTMMVMLLLEWVLRNYFGNVRMELRTFLEFFLYCPTEVLTNHRRALYRIESTGLKPDKAELLHAACKEISARKIRRPDGRLLVFEAVDKSGHEP